jgi:rRNA small subunit pseudouridine methyltransferase Nep1
MLHLVLAEAELELVPAAIASHPSVRAQARRKNKKATEILLDSSFHHKAMRRLPEAERRGRPDITHTSLLLALDSPLNREGLLRVYVHTRNDEVIRISPETRLPRSYHRFVGLMEELFKTGAVPPEKPLLTLERKTLIELLNELEGKKIVFSEKGIKKKWAELFQPNLPTIVVVGAFPHGDFHIDWNKTPCELICVDPEPLSADTVVSRALFAYEQAIGLQEKRLKK